MGILSKFVKRGGDDNDDELDLEEDALDQPASGGEDEDRGGGLLGWIRNRGNKGDQDDEDDEEAREDPEDIPPPAPRGSADEEGPEESAVQVVRLEGVPDVRPVGGESGRGMTPAPQNVPSSESSQGGQSPAPPADAAPEAQSPLDDTPSLDIPEEPAEEDSADEKGLGISLKDIFEEEVEVDETLRDLAESMDDVPVGQLAEELREFLAELEKIME